MTIEIAIVFFIILIGLFLFVTEKLPVDIVSIIIMVLFMVTGILTPSEGFAGFSNPAVITVGAMFVVSASIFRTGALNPFARLLVKATKLNYILGMFFLMLGAGILSAFINDTAVVALFMPIVISVAKDSNVSPSKLLIPLSFGALLGGTCTLIGTSTNILVSGIAKSHGLEPFGMFEMAPFGMIALGIGITYMLIAGIFLLPKREVSENVADEFDLHKYLTEIVLLPNSKSIGKSLRDSPLTKELDIEVLEIIREDRSRAYPSAVYVLKAGDILRVRCDIDKLRQLKNKEGFEIMADFRYGHGTEDHEKVQLIEAVITPSSTLQSRSLSEINFRAKFDAPVLAIRQRANIIYEKLSDIKLLAGDVLLLSIEDEKLNPLRKSSDFIILSESPSQKFRYNKIIPALVIIAGIVTVAALDIAPIIMTAAIGCIALILVGCVTVEEAYGAIEWKVLFLLAGVSSMGVALEKTGGAELISAFLVENVGECGPQVLLSVLFLFTFIMTNFMSNNATAALMAPIAIVAASAMEVDPRPFLLAITFAASMSFITPMGYQTNTMIYIPGNYKFIDFIKVGTPLNFILWVAASILIPMIYPF